MEKDDFRMGQGLVYQQTIHMVTEGMILGKVLDIGCGSRVYYNMKNVTSWTGVEISGIMLDEVQFLSHPLPDHREMFVLSCDDIDFPTNSFDTICTMFMLHHLGVNSKKKSRERVLNVINNIHRMLKTGGKLLVGECAANLIEWPYHAAFPIVYYLFEKLAKVEMPFFWSRKQFASILKDAGFENLHMIHIPIVDPIYNPVSGWTLPAWMSNLLQTMTIYITTK